jgi:hypothetical protein
MASVTGSAFITRSPFPRTGTTTASLPLLLLLVLAAILVPAVAFLVPAGRTREAPAPAAAAPLTAEERTRVLTYAAGLRPDDALVEVRPGVRAKRSNVEGVRLDGRTVYYDLTGHQSFGPWRRGQVREADLLVLARAGAEPVQIVVYALP